MKLASIVTTTVAAAGLALANLAGVANATDITGAGATFPFPIYAKWAEDYKKASGFNTNYQYRSAQVPASVRFRPRRSILVPPMPPWTKRSSTKMDWCSFPPSSAALRWW